MVYFRKEGGRKNGALKSKAKNINSNIAIIELLHIFKYLEKKKDIE